MNNGATVAEFERAFAEYVGARYAIALVNGTATLHTALVALGVKPGDSVAVPPLTMSATTIAVLHAGAVPVFVDVDPKTWLKEEPSRYVADTHIAVSLYGLHYGRGAAAHRTIDDAAQTLRRHTVQFPFTSYSFQNSKILPLGEGGMLVTNNEALATRAREFSSLGYRMRADQPRIDPKVLKSPTFERHHSLGWNYRMSDVVAERGLKYFEQAYECVDKPTSGQFIGDIILHSSLAALLLQNRRKTAALYRAAIEGCSWLTPQHVPEGWTHDYWTYAVATDTPARCLALLDAVERHGGERPYPAWRLSYQEPALRHIVTMRANMFAQDRYGLMAYGLCPVAESLQPRLVQFQTNDLASAERNAAALRRAIEELGP
jgi:perosamine synthetase